MCDVCNHEVEHRPHSHTVLNLISLSRCKLMDCSIAQAVHSVQEAESREIARMFLDRCEINEIC